MLNFIQINIIYSYQGIKQQLNNLKYKEKEAVRMIKRSILIIMVCVMISSQQMFDFTYTELTVSKSESTRQIKLEPFPLKIQQYEFPQACQINQLLTSTQLFQDHSVQISNTDGLIQFLKSKATEFLKLSDKAQLIKKNIKSLPSFKDQYQVDINQEQLSYLLKQEQKLDNINSLIDSKAIQLKLLVIQNMKQQQNPIFIQASLNFQKRATKQKIALFQQVLGESSSRRSQQTNIKAVQKYFNQLDGIFQSQSKLIDTIDSLLKNHNQLNMLKANISNLITQIKAHNLTISQKQQCSSQYSRIQSKQQNDKQLHKLIETLKIKKIEFSQPNKYCEGVVEKLIYRIRKVLTSYEYVYICAQGLQQSLHERQILMQQLKQAEKRLDDLEMSKGINQFKDNFEKNRQAMFKKMEQLKTFKLESYSQKPEQIKSVIIASKRRLTQIQAQLSNLPIRETKDLSHAHMLIKQKVNQIKELKGQYCQQTEIYNTLSKQIEDKIYLLEQQDDYNRWLRNFSQDKHNQLQNVKVQMATIQKEFTYQLQ